VDGDAKDDVLLADKRDIVWYHNPGWEKHVIARNLTLRDNVCIAARDLNGDGRCEIAVGANWNPGETKDETASGSVHLPSSPRRIARNLGRRSPCRMSRPFIDASLAPQRKGPMGTRSRFRFTPATSKARAHRSG